MLTSCILKSQALLTCEQGLELQHVGPMQSKTEDHVLCQGCLYLSSKKSKEWPSQNLFLKAARAKVMTCMVWQKGH